MNDLLNAAFEIVGAYFVWKDVLVLMKDKHIAGVYWPTRAFFATWGFWNLYYYPSVGHWASALAGAVLALGSLTWTILAWRYTRRAT